MQVNHCLCISYDTSWEYLLRTSRDFTAGGHFLYSRNLYVCSCSIIRKSYILITTWQLCGFLTKFVRRLSVGVSNINEQFKT